MARRCLGLLTYSPAALAIPFLALVALAATASGQLPRTQLTSIFPPSGKFGSTVDVQVRGEDQDEVDRLFFSHPGITAEPKMTEESEFEPAEVVPGQFTVEIAGDVPPGVYEARVAGRYGVSNPRAFVVGLYDEAVEADGSNQKESATPVELDSTVNGYVDNNSRDYFQVSLKEGQRVLIDCAAQRIDSRLNGTLVLLDGDGKELARSRDYFGDDPFIDFTAPEPGDYYLRLRDFIYRGGNEYFYRLKVHLGPHLDFIFPPSGLPGSSDEYTIYGRNLPDGKPSDVEVEGVALESQQVNVPLPDDAESVRQLSLEGYVPPREAALDSYDYRLNTSNPVTLYYALAPVVKEQESNDDPEAVQTVEPPCEVVGQFYPARDVDWIEFEAKKGQSFYVDVLSHRLGLDTDPRLLVQKVTADDEGEDVVEDVKTVDDSSDRDSRINSDFDTSTDDPTYRLAVDEDATYRLAMRDQFGGSENDPRSVYRLVIREAKPDFRLIAVPQPLPTPDDANTVLLGSGSLRKGGTTAVTVRAERRDGFSGEIELLVEGLPTGVSTPGALIGKNEQNATLIFEAAEDAPDWAGTIQILGKARDGDSELVRHARGGAVIWGTGNRQQEPPDFRATRDIALAVMSEPAPAQVEVPEEQVWETSLGGKLEIPIEVTRRRDFDGDLKLVANGLPKQLKPDDITVKGDASEGTVTLEATDGKAKAGTYSFYLRADTQAKLVRNPDAISAAEQDQRRLEKIVTRLTEQAEEAKQAAAAEADSQAAGEENTEADQAAAEIAAKLEKAQAAKEAADKRLEAAKKENAPEDFNFLTISAPVQLRVAETPLALSTNAPEGGVEQGAETTIPVELERLYGFADKVAVSVEIPDGVDGLEVEDLSLDGQTSAGKLQVTADEDATVGKHTLTVQASAKFNNVDVETTEQVTLEVKPKS